MPNGTHTHRHSTRHAPRKRHGRPRAVRFRRRVTATLLLGTLMLVLAAPSPSLATSSSSRQAKVAVAFLAVDGTPLPQAFRPDGNATTFLVVHGFNDSATSDGSIRQAVAIQDRFPSANVVIVDWRVECDRGADDRGWWSGLLSLHSRYCQAVEAAPSIGQAVAKWMREQGILPSRTVISGFSLGAQIGAFVSNETAKPDVLGEPALAILAADPAGPMFELRPEHSRLDPSDAREVIAIHTTNEFGDENRVGTLDIYVRWQEDNRDIVSQHASARTLVTESFAFPDMHNVDGTPFGANALGHAGATVDTYMLRSAEFVTTGLPASPATLASSHRVRDFIGHEAAGPGTAQAAGPALP